MEILEILELYGNIRYQVKKKLKFKISKRKVDLF